MELKWKPALTVIIQGFMVIGALCASESFVGDPVFQAGVARVCPDSDFSITCTHLTTLTAWRALSTAGGVVCVASILHANPDTIVGCGNPAVFNIDGISNTATSPNCSSSTARITGTADVDGLTIACLNDPGVTNQVGTVDISLIGQSAPGNLCLLAGDITEVAGSVPRQWDVTLRWDEPVLEAGVTVASYVSTATPPAICVSSDCTGPDTFRTWRLALNSLTSFTVAAVGTTSGNACTVTSEPSEVITVNIVVPNAPTIANVDVTFDPSTGNITAVVTQSGSVDATANIAESSTKVLDGSIIEYIASLMIGDTLTSCDAFTCSTAVGEEFSTTPIVISLVARNVVGPGPSTEANGVLFTVSRVNGATADSVTLICDGAPDCAIMYGREGSSLSETGTSGVALENLVVNTVYFYEARTTVGVVNVAVAGSFGTCECSPDFFGSDEASTVCQELDMGYIGGVRSQSVSTGVSGTVCYDGTAETSTAVFECTNGGTCEGGCTAECVCAESGAAGVWSSDFASVACVTTGLSTGAIVGIVVGAIAGLLLIAIAVVLLALCIVRASSVSQAHSDPGPVYAEVGPAVQFQVEANTAYGPVRKKAAAEQFEMEGNAAYGPVRR